MVELRLICASEGVGAVGDALEALDALSVSTQDADAGTARENALFGEPETPPPAQGWARTRITALFTQEAQARHAARVIAAQDFFAGGRIEGIVSVVEQDWVRLTQSQFAPVPITPDFWIVPSWHQPPAEARRVIRLDPGLAFGTGTHPTTRMCLRRIAAQPPLGLRVLDYGCGSGILAIAAALFGAAHVDAVDIDPVAVHAAAANAAANRVAIDCGPPERAQGRYNVVLANILASPLKVLAPLLCGHVADGSALILAGILERQTAELQAAYGPALALEVADREDGWVLLAGRRHRRPRLPTIVVPPW